METILKFYAYEVEESIYRRNIKSKESNIEITPTIRCDIMENEDENHLFAIRLTVELGHEDFQDIDFYVKTSIIGFFEGESEEYNLISNAVAILFPYVRSLISDMTSKGTSDPIILPPINVNALLNDQT